MTSDEKTIKIIKSIPDREVYYFVVPTAPDGIYMELYVRKHFPNKNIRVITNNETNLLGIDKSHLYFDHNCFKD